MLLTGNPDRIGDAQLAILRAAIAEQHPAGTPAGPIVLEGQPRSVTHQKGLRLAAADL